MFSSLSSTRMVLFLSTCLFSWDFRNSCCYILVAWACSLVGSLFGGYPRSPSIWGVFVSFAASYFMSAHLFKLILSSSCLKFFFEFLFYTSSSLFWLFCSSFSVLAMSSTAFSSMFLKNLYNASSYAPFIEVDSEILFWIAESSTLSSPAESSSKYFCL